MSSKALSTVLFVLCFSGSLIADDLLDLRRAEQIVYRQAVERIAPYVVKIETIGGAQPPADGDTDLPAEPDEQEEDGTPPPEPSPFRDDLGSGFLVADGPTTGIIYESDGWILASSFNFVRDPAHITVELADERRFVAELVARDKVRKLALLRINEKNLEVPEWIPVDKIQVGQRTLALGRGFGGSQTSVTVGIVSALDRMMGNAIQTDAKLSPANYGGPLIGLDGRILGICVPMAQRPGELAGVEFYDAGIGFAMPRARVDQIATELKSGKSFHRGWLGISLDTRARDKVLIRAVADPSPVKDVGIQGGDVIVEANGKKLKNFANLVQAIYMVPAGEAVQLLIQRGELMIGFEVKLARSDELGPLVEPQPPTSADNPFPLPNKKKPWP